MSFLAISRVFSNISFSCFFGTPPAHQKSPQYFLLALFARSGSENTSPSNSKLSIAFASVFLMKRCAAPAPFSRAALADQFAKLTVPACLAFFASSLPISFTARRRSGISSPWSFLICPAFFMISSFFPWSLPGCCSFGPFSAGFLERAWSAAAANA